MRRFLVNPMQQSDAAIIGPGSNGLGPECEAAVIGEVVIVRTEEAGEPDAITVAGEKLHDAPGGNPEQDREALSENPFCGVTETVVVPLFPATSVSDAGERDTRKLGVAADVVMV